MQSLPKHKRHCTLSRLQGSSGRVSAAPPYQAVLLGARHCANRGCPKACQQHCITYSPKGAALHMYQGLLR